jgi:hypothetical protein
MFCGATGCADLLCAVTADVFCPIGTLEFEQPAKTNAKIPAARALPLRAVTFVISILLEV